MGDIWTNAINAGSSFITRGLGYDEARDARKAEAAALAEKRAAMLQAANVYSAYRPQANEARMNALKQRMSAYQGVNNAMASRFGKGATQDFSQLTQNPMSPTMMYQGNRHLPAGHEMEGPLANYLKQFEVQPGAGQSSGGGSALGKKMTSAIQAEAHLGKKHGNANPHKPNETPYGSGWGPEPHPPSGKKPNSGGWGPKRPY